MRKIIHIDMDAFYAAVEQRDNAELRGKPIVVGGSPFSRGVVATCSYEARHFNIHSAMPSVQAAKLCPDVIFIKPRFDVYRQVSEEILDIFRSYTHLVEPLSLDEAYLDVTQITATKNCLATRLAREILDIIRKTTNLSASAGISYNKFLAKIASDVNKPNGYYTIPPARSADFLDALPIRKFHGVGVATEKRMQKLGITTGADLKQFSLEALTQEFGKIGAYYYHVVRGIDDRPVVVNRVRKSIGAEKTFEQDLTNKPEMLEELMRQARKIAMVLVQRELTGRTIAIKVKYNNFEQITRSVTLEQSLTGLHEMLAFLPMLLDKTDAGQRAVRLLGVSVSNLMASGRNKGPRQLDLL